MKHAGQKRETVSLITGKNHPYAIHLEETATRSRLLIETVFRFVESNSDFFRDSEQCPEKMIALAHQIEAEIAFLTEHPEIVEIIARCHDLFEDCAHDICDETCFNFGNGDHPCVHLPFEVRGRLNSLGLGGIFIRTSMEGMKMLTKKPFPTPAERNGDLFQRLSGAPLYLKLIKLADQWHNLSTLSGRRFHKAVQNYLKIRQSWETIFSEEELFLLTHTDFLEQPEVMRYRTSLFQDLFREMEYRRKEKPEPVYLSHPGEGIERVERACDPDELPDIDLEAIQRRYEAEIARMNGPKERIGGIWINPAFLREKSSEEKIVDLSMAYFMGGQRIPAEGESQLMCRSQMECDGLIILEKALWMGLRPTQQFVGFACYRDEAVSRGQFPYYGLSDGTTENIGVFLRLLGMTGPEFLAIQSEAQFRARVRLAIHSFKSGIADS